MPRYDNYPDGMTREHWKHINGPDYEKEEIVFCPTCEEEKELLVTGFRTDREFSAYCPDCDTSFSIGEDDDYGPDPDDERDRRMEMEYD
jgi:uncharacterized Zn finger protein (UPF0148 family)